jgi:hypothetical protein
MWVIISAIVIAIVLFVEVAAIILQQRQLASHSRSPEFVDPQAQDLPAAIHETQIYS